MTFTVAFEWVEGLGFLAGYYLSKNARISDKEVGRP